MSGHKLILIGKHQGNMETVIFEDINKLINILPLIYQENLFYIEIEINNEEISLEEYKSLLLTNPAAKNFKFPENISTVKDLENWISAWKALEEVFELSYQG